MAALRGRINKILLRIKEGDSSAEDELVKCVHSHLLIVAKIHLRDKNEAEDVVSAAYRRVLRYIDKFDRNKDGYNWLCKIVQHEAYRNNERNRKYDHDPLDTYVERPDRRNFEERLASEDAVDWLLKDYPEKVKRAILLHIVDGVSIRKAADEVGLKKSNVHRLIKTALKEMKEKILKMRDKEQDKRGK